LRADITAFRVFWAANGRRLGRGALKKKFLNTEMPIRNCQSDEVMRSNIWRKTGFKALFGYIWGVAIMVNLITLII
jgi:hypothetical protein